MKTKILQLVLPEELHERLEAVARSQRRSKSAQAVMILEAALRHAPQVRMPATDEERQAMLERMK